jgi:hypothetical protein
LAGSHNPTGKRDNAAIDVLGKSITLFKRRVIDAVLIVRPMGQFMEEYRTNQIDRLALGRLAETFAGLEILYRSRNERWQRTI